MRQELVRGVLLSGLVEIFGAMTIAVLWTDSTSPQGPCPKASTKQQVGIDLDRNKSKRQTSPQDENRRTLQ
jgi:hypothetical protein